MPAPKKSTAAKKAANPHQGEDCENPRVERYPRRGMTVIRCTQCGAKIVE